ncbi:MAG: hypothetical protein AAFR81_29295, partial [Chloroflexota bacterium]
MLFDLEGYRLRKLDPAQGTKPLDFGGGGVNGSINLDGRFIAINSYHPEHGIVTLTSVPPFPDADRYDQAKVRAYRKSLVTNAGFGLAFEQDIIEREYYLIEDAVPFLRFTLADGTVAECVTLTDDKWVRQMWRTSQRTKGKATGNVWLMRSSYTQLTEGGILPMPSVKTILIPHNESQCFLRNDALNRFASIIGFTDFEDTDSDGLRLNQDIEVEENFEVGLVIAWSKKKPTQSDFLETLKSTLDIYRAELPESNNLVTKRAYIYGSYCSIDTHIEYTNCILTDHMILPLSWTRDAHYVVLALNQIEWVGLESQGYISWLKDIAWRGTFCKYFQRPNNRALP